MASDTISHFTPLQKLMASKLLFRLRVTKIGPNGVDDVVK